MKRSLGCPTQPIPPSLELQLQSFRVSPPHTVTSHLVALLIACVLETNEIQPRTVY